MQVLRTASVCGLLALLICGTGCPVSIDPVVFDPATYKRSSQQAEQGLVWMFPGVMGLPWELGHAYRGLREAGLDKEVQFFAWDVPAPDFISHLVRYEDNLAQAQRVADKIVAYRQKYPDQSIDLVGYSAGGFMALVVAEALPVNVRLRNVVICQPGISPSYDLTPALQHVDGQLVNFYSPGDWALSGVFTWLLGTMDRRYTATAGMRGFDLEVAAPDPEFRARVVQIGWQPFWADYNHPGNHIAILQYLWNKYFVSPYVVEPGKLRIDPPPELPATAE
jgi:pimeloyl-ACP methyl ester carboxylesterase